LFSVLQDELFKGKKYIEVLDDSKNPFGSRQSFCHPKEKSYSTGAVAMM